MEQTKELFLTPESIEFYLKSKAEEGVQASTINKYRGAYKNLLSWLGSDCLVNALRLRKWREHLECSGYSKVTVQKYVSRINSLLKYYGRKDLCIPRPLQKDLTGKKFGYLTVLGATDQRSHRYVVWRCVCKCGKEIEVPSTSLIEGNTTSCGCLNIEILQHINRYEEGTELRAALQEKILNPNSASGYVGVQPKRDKWTAYINYKGVRYHLGTYNNMEEAVKARARAKELVMEDAARIYEETAHLYGETPHRPPKPTK